MTGVDMHMLDYPQADYESLDPGNMRQKLRDLSRHCRDGWYRAMDWSPLDQIDPVNQVVIGGMGGWAIAGQLVADLAVIQTGVPIRTMRDSRCPSGVDRNTLFMCCSYSGNTKEILSLFWRALHENAQVIAITEGGDLADQARSQGVPLLTVATPVDSRSGVGYSLMLLLGVLQRMGIVNIHEDEVTEALNTLDGEISKWSEYVPAEKNRAKCLARNLKDKIVMVCGASFLSGMASYWAAQLRENSKIWDLFASEPGSLASALLNPERMLFFLLQEPGNGFVEVSAGYQSTRELTAQPHILHKILTGVGDSALAQLLAMLSLGDYVNYYLALFQGIVPSDNLGIHWGTEV